MQKYNPQKIEKKWQDKWDKSEIYKAEDNSKKPKYYCLIEFPYPSGAGLHVGHLRSHIAIDIVARKKRMSGYNVMYPIGWDAFGLPTENFAIKTKTHPKIVTEKNIKNFTRQIKSYGPSFDWSREINTTDPRYYKWTQWIFLKFFNSFYDEKLNKARDIKDLDIPKNLNDNEKRKYIDDHRMAYESEMAINWCPSCKIGLANEEVVNGACERCSAPVEKKIMKQWMLRITKYAERLIKDLNTVDYLDKIKTQQINWIGRSEGAEVEFRIKNYESRIKVFTTRPDTLFGCTYMVLAPEHKLITNYKLQITNYNEVKKYIEQAKNKSDLDRTDLAKEKTGVELKGIKAINPVNNEEIPIWVADYVLASYGTGAIMAVPAHDERDFEFAKKFGLEIKQVIREFIEQIDIQKQTLKSYNENVDEYDKKTINEIEGELKKWIDYILSLINKDTKILELGSGTGKDADYMENLGYKVERTDGCPGFIKYQKSKGKSINILELINDKINYLKYNLIFANAVLLHFNEKQTELILKKISNGLKKNGVLAFSVKAGKGEEITDRKIGAKRYFKYWSINEIKQILNKFPLEIVKIEPWKDKRGIVFIWVVVRKKTDSVDLVYQGININSNFLNGLETKEAKIKITKWLSKNNIGKKAVNYKLRDWVFSRQHYWGEPIPIVKCEKCGNVALEKKDLPLKLPEVKNYEPTDTGESPLAKIDKWVNVKCPKCGGNAKRETDTMPNWAGSSWYYLRYVDPDNDQEFASQEKLKYWMPVDLYNGGMEHTTLHLLYSRFWHKFLYDLGFVNTAEPYKIRRSHGMILAEDGQKMSKSRGNTVNPDEIIKQYGADTVRLYEMFMGPYNEAIPWNTNSLIGMSRFLEKIWKLNIKVQNQNIKVQNPELELLLHQTIKKVTEDIDNLKFNTAISQLMILLNKLEKEEKISTIHYSQFLILLSPFAPHITEELWEILGNKESIHLQSFPKYNPELIKEKEITLVIQINGKLRDQIKVPAEISEEDAKKLALESEKIKKWIDGKEIKKIIFVKGRLVNVVI